MKWTCERCGLQVEDKRVSNDCNGEKGQKHAWEETRLVEKRQEDLKWMNWLNSHDGINWQNGYKHIKEVLEVAAGNLQKSYIQSLETAKEKFNKMLELKEAENKLKEKEKKGKKKMVRMDDFEDAFNELNEQLHKNDLQDNWDEYLDEISKRYDDEISIIIQKGKLMMHENNQQHGVKEKYFFNGDCFYFNLDNFLINSDIRKQFINDVEFRKKYKIGIYHN